MTLRQQLLGLIDGGNASDRRLSMLATGSTDTIRNIRRGANPKTDTLEAICAALGVGIHLGPEKTPPLEAMAPPEIIGALGLPGGASLQDAARAIERWISGQRGLAGEALRDEIVRVLKSETQALRDEIMARPGAPRVADDLTDDQALANPGISPAIRDHLPGTRPVAVHRLQAAAGGGALDLDETVRSYAYFRHEWLSRHGLVANRCRIIGVMGESMEPTLPVGCVILLDHNRRHRREGRIFVVRTADGLVIKRAGKGSDGRWQLVSDHPRWPDAPWPDDATITGEVKWMAREL